VKRYATLILAVFAVSWAAILIRVCGAPPLIMSFYRMGIAALILLPFAGFHRRQPWLRSRSSVATALGAGLFLGLHFASWITSLQLTTVASSVVLVTTTPVFAAIFSARLLGEKAGRKAWAGIVLSVAGAALIAWGDYSGAPAVGPRPGAALLGDVLAFAGAIFAAAYLTLGRTVRERAPLVGYLVIVYGTGAAAVAAGALLRGDRFFRYPPRDWLLFAVMAIVPNLIGHSLLNWAVRRMRTYVVNVAVLGEPILATIYAIVLFREVPGPVWAAGTLMILSGLLTVFLAERPGVIVEMPPD